MRLFVVRHGETVGNVEKKHIGQNETPLTEKGKAQALKIRDVLAKFSFDRVYSSDLSRAIDTQRIALPGVEGIRTPLLREFAVGSLGGKDFEEVRQILDGKRVMEIPGQYKRFGGESDEDMAARLKEFLKMLEQDPCDNVIAFAHNGTLGVLLETILDVHINRIKVVSKNCAIHVFEYENGVWKLVAWNYMGEI